MTDILDKNTSLTMICPDLAPVPQYPLPEGISVRWYEPGDEARWVAIQAAADPYNPITPSLFRREYGHDATRLHRCMFFLMDQTGRAVGTNTAWYDGAFRGEIWGRIHWVAILPDRQGQGLGKVLMTVACNRLLELGYNRAYLLTSTERVSAINLYRQFGFVPEIRSAEERQSWQALAPYLKSPSLF